MRAASPDAAVRAIPDGSRVFLGSATGVPRALVAALARRERPGEWIAGYLVEPLPVAPPEPVTLVSLQPSPALWASGARRTATAPVRYSDYEWIFTSNGSLPLDVALVQVSQPGPDGRYSLGTSVGGTCPAIESADLVIAQVNAAMPYTFGAGELAPDELDIVVEHDEPLPVVAARPPTADAAAIAARVAAEVTPGGCVQLGVGRLPDAVAHELAQRGRYTVHSGMISDWCPLLRDPERPAVTTEALGSAEFYRWLDRNDEVRFERAAGVHLAEPAPGRPWFAINAGLQADLRGAVNAESVGGRALSGPAGLPDFALAAQRTDGGASIVMIAATDSTRTRSGIVAQLAAPDPTTLPAWLADRIVTECGIARLRARSDSERAAAMIAIASPDRRAELAARSTVT